MLKESDTAPSLKVTTSGGETVNLAAPGQKLVLFFYPKDLTPGCTTEAKDFSATIQDFAEADTKVIGVSRDSMARHGKFIDKEGLTVPLVSDEDGAVSDAFGAWGLKKFMGREFMGMIRSTFLIGADGTILKAWSKVKVKGHVDEVLETVRQG